MHKAIAKLIRQTEVNEDGCLVWIGLRLSNGYGQVYFDGKMRSVHRLAYTAWKGPIPEGLQIDHLCRNRACWRPDHLEAVTQQENIRRGLPYRARCPLGHRLTDDNVFQRPGSERYFCRKCTELYVRMRGPIALADLNRAEERPNV